ncbi:hypothetical protein [Desulfobotulus sp.]|uniref:hypothetical protein n=1 Tax=Desulfobotulus sp. TaxID=1940337 RepID=UPI002A362160|nr:hypothetical protein [Desulfobotulus sp.]MDY0164468.1 hypothetical protein [Desulfobotulus sp.]
MTFRESLLKKMALDEQVRKIRRSLEADTGTVDRENLRRLLAEGAYVSHKIRDLEIWMREVKGEAPDLVVVDNGLGRYRTTLEDVALRKSPTVKEMISLRNARKILSDSDVLVSRREKTLDFLQRHALGFLDLSWTPQDISALADDGAVALEIEDAEGVETVLRLFAELLGLSGAPAPWEKPGWWLRCLKDQEGGIRNLVAFSRDSLRLAEVKGPLDAKDSETHGAIRSLLSGEKKGDLEGKAVFSALMDAVIGHASDRNG